MGARSVPAMFDARALAAEDRAVLWHPFTQQQGWAGEDFPVIVRGEGCRLVDADGREYLDGTSSLWCNVHGHRHPRIDAAIAEQFGRVAHTTMLGLSHPPAIRLARRLVDLAPERLSRVFFSDNGSTAVEVALKMAYGFWHARGGWWRSRLVCLGGAYHGDTMLLAEQVAVLPAVTEIRRCGFMTRIELGGFPLAAAWVTR